MTSSSNAAALTNSPSSTSPAAPRAVGSRRSIEVDFFRGLALVVIMLDHIPQSLVSKVTLHNYAFCDAAEMFVFVGGYSVAAAYTAIMDRQGERAAAQRFLKRGVEIYRAFLLLAAMMLVLGMLFHGLKLDTPEVLATEAGTFMRRPLGMLLDIASLRRQPFLSSVLPMYLLFALSAPAVLALARRAPWLTLVISIGIWALAPILAAGLPTAYPEGWPFNPFAWQLMFVSGAIFRLKPVDAEVLATPWGGMLTRIAVVAVVGFAIWHIFLLSAPTPGYDKQNLALSRLLNFAALAWCASWITARGWAGRAAAALPALVRTGQHSLPCFVAGACISVSMDALSRPFAAAQPWLVGSCDDILATVLLLSVAWIAASLKKRGRKPAASRTAGARVPSGGPQRTSAAVRN
ncbi:OpgC domain-containing protein [Robbsia andropogonis]|uniref:OpgC domain-containing protein n=1 Tax=Robbsia andropogonis TaxID=28092 RepID=UPI0004BA5A6B|nr:OpgC domain-containing protein [Robbsia andropogonis]MCP1116559.1 OpgC domain-containing protein [Robbsia andropogonis]MCP1126762.1 OpgC domain-containing protein [Robbsia andropogonis]